MIVTRFLLALKRDERGAAMTEYLILLGLLAGGVAAAVTLFGTELSSAFGTAGALVP